MVKQLHVALSDEDHAKAKRVKDDLRLTWEEFILRAAEELDESEEE